METEFRASRSTAAANTPCRSVSGTRLMNSQMPIHRLAGMMCYGDDEDALRLGPINHREGKIADKDPSCIL
jgi:hypothetical protein